jgi:hypothetical protein
MMRQRFLGALTGAVLAAALLAGCSGSTGSPEATPDLDQFCSLIAAETANIRALDYNQADDLKKLVDYADQLGEVAPSSPVDLKADVTAWHDTLVELQEMSADDDSRGGVVTTLGENTQKLQSDVGTACQG